MKDYPVALPPKHPGIYALVHQPTGKTYIGKSDNLGRRYGEWRSVFQIGLGHKNKQLRDFIAQTKASDWVFRVIKELPGDTSDAITELEARVITAVQQRSPDKLLNASFIGSAPPAEPRNKSVVTDAGAHITTAEAARRLGCSTKSLQKRLAKYRDKGVTVLPLETLRERTEKYRAMGNQQA